MENSKRFFWVLCTVFVGWTAGQCPNGCSGQGTCETGNVCNCFDGFDYAVDCSLRTCPKGAAWADKAYKTDTAHSQAECSNAGLCDRSTGLCSCFEGYTGAACSRSACPNECSARGICMTIRDLGESEGPDYDQPGAGGDGVGPFYTNWDHSAVTMCNCHPGYFGPDCSSAMCPKADDPVSINQYYRTIEVEVGSDDNVLTGTFGLTFVGYTTSFSADSSGWSSDSCKRAIEALENVDKASCNKTIIDGDRVKYNISFMEFPLFPMESNVHNHNGNPPLDAITCDKSRVSGTGVYCNITDVINTNVREYIFCAGRGMCDFSTGTCACFDGFTGLGCTESSYYSKTANSLPGAFIETAGGDYTGTVLELNTEKGFATDFNLIDAKIDSTSVLHVRGDGLMTAHGLEVTTSGHTVDNGGLTVTADGATIADGGMDVTTAASATPVLKLTASSTAYQETALDIISAGTSSTGYKLIEAGSSGSKVFTVRGDGKTTIAAGGLTVTAGGGTITAGGFMVSAGGATVTDGGIAVTAGGLRVRDGGATIESSSVNETLLNLLADGATLNNGSVLMIQTNSPAVTKDPYYLIKSVYDADGTPTTVFSVTGEPKTKVESGGLNVVGGATIASGGLNVSAGGLFVAGGGGTINGNLFVAGSVSYTGTSTQASDARFKQSVENVSSNVALETILKLRPVTYQWNDQAPESRDQTRQLGFIAQDLLAALPRSLVNVVRQFDSEGHLGVSYDRIPVLLAGALQELDARHQKQISNLSSELERLKHLVTKLQDELQALREQPNLSLERMA